MKISLHGGSPCGKVNLDLVHEGLIIGEGYALSLRDVFYTYVKEGLESVLDLGAARASIIWSGNRDNNGRLAYLIVLESPNVQDFIALHREIMRRFGMKFEHIDFPYHPAPPNEQSFVRGVRNDVRRFCQLLTGRLADARRRVGFAIFRH